MIEIEETLWSYQSELSHVLSCNSIHHIGRLFPFGQCNLLGLFYRSCSPPLRSIFYYNLRKGWGADVRCTDMTSHKTYWESVLYTCYDYHHDYIWRDNVTFYRISVCGHHGHHTLSESEITWHAWDYIGKITTFATNMLSLSFAAYLYHKNQVFFQTISDLCTAAHTLLHSASAHPSFCWLQTFFCTSAREQIFFSGELQTKVEERKYQILL